METKRLLNNYRDYTTKQLNKLQKSMAILSQEKLVKISWIVTKISYSVTILSWYFEQLNYHKYRISREVDSEKLFKELM